MAEYRIHNADIHLKEDCTDEDLIDVIEGSRIYIPCIYVVNKIDQMTEYEIAGLETLPNYCPISAHTEENLTNLLEMVWDQLKMIRVYTKPKGQLPDSEEPVVLAKDATVEQFCKKIHKGLIKDLKFALVWGTSVKHIPQKVGKDHVLHDQDVIQIVKR
eukprot:scaffold772_cov339-Pavlova_lutheri.AAC.8